MSFCESLLTVALYYIDLRRFYMLIYTSSSQILFSHFFNDLLWLGNSDWESRSSPVKKIAVTEFNELDTHEWTEIII